MIKEIKDLLENTVREIIPAAVVARSKAEESRATMARKFPLVSLITNPGQFDDRQARIYRYADEDAGSWMERYVRGSRIIPILLRCWAGGEDETDEIFSKILPAIPRKWEYDGFEGLVLINGEEHSDFADSVTKLYLSVVEIQFSIDVARAAVPVPTIKEMVLDQEPEQQH
jgi:hypothetical protein